MSLGFVNGSNGLSMVQAFRTSESPDFETTICGLKS